MNRNWMEKKSPIYQSLTLQGWFLIKLLKFVQKCFSFCLTDQVFWNVGKFHILKCWKVSYLDGHSMIQTSFLITSHNYYAKHWRNTSSISAPFFTLKIEWRFSQSPISLHGTTCWVFDSFWISSFNGLFECAFDLVGWYTRSMSSFSQRKNPINHFPLLSSWSQTTASDCWNFTCLIRWSVLLVLILNHVDHLIYTKKFHFFFSLIFIWWLSGFLVLDQLQFQWIIKMASLLCIYWVHQALKDNFIS